MSGEQAAKQGRIECTNPAVDRNVQLLVSSKKMFDEIQNSFITGIGLTLLIGALMVIDLRGLGLLRRMPLIHLHKLVPVIKEDDLRKLFQAVKGSWGRPHAHGTAGSAVQERTESGRRDSSRAGAAGPARPRRSRVHPRHGSGSEGR